MCSLGILKSKPPTCVAPNASFLSLSHYTLTKEPQVLKFTPKHQSIPCFTNQNIVKLNSQILQQTFFIFSTEETQLERKIKQLRIEIMATSISATGFFHGSWGSSIMGEDWSNLGKSVGIGRGRVAVRAQPMMKNVNEGKGLFAPIVVATRNIIGKKRFNQIRGKAIALHSQVITEFCKSIGADAKQRQGLIRLAKKNGERLGFLA